MSPEAIQRTTRCILGVGAVGYPIAFLGVFWLRRWLGVAGRGWVRVTLNALIFLLAVLAVLMGLSLGSSYGWFSKLSLNQGLAISFGTIGALALAPWVLVAALALWLWRTVRAGRRAGKRRGGGIE